MAKYLDFDGVKAIVNWVKEKFAFVYDAIAKSRLDVVSITGSSVSGGNVELTGTSAPVSTITASAVSKYYGGDYVGVGADRLRIRTGSATGPVVNSGIVGNNVRAQVTLPNTAGSTATYYGTIEGSSQSASVSFRMLTRIYAKAFSSAPTSLDMFLDGVSVLGDSIGKTLTIPVTGTQHVYVAVPGYLTLSGATQPLALGAPLGFSLSGTFSKSLGGAAQTWKIYKSASNVTSDIQLKFN
ncbi:MAG: hypothetical protein SPF56_08630 [Bacteroidaceae bacterium]|nr:hypothetical protein [Bacteroidaceae bacterium]